MAFSVATLTQPATPKQQAASSGLIAAIAGEAVRADQQGNVVVRHRAIGVEDHRDLREERGCIVLTKPLARLERHTIVTFFQRGVGGIQGSDTALLVRDTLADLCPLAVDLLFERDIDPPPKASRPASSGRERSAGCPPQMRTRP